MMKLDIATGDSRMTKVWKNRQIEWPKLVEKLSETHRTAETFKQYLSYNKDRQASIKDIGGFVGGYLTGGKRSPRTVKHRQIVALDIDFGHEFIWDDFTLLYDCEALIYSTHHYGEGEFRLRLVLPLSEAVSPEQYEAISRRIAGDLGIEHFDGTTFQPERLMYWPSTSKDAEYVFEHQTGSWLDVNEMLSRYHSWADISEWPVCDNEKERVEKGIKQQDPTEKEGVVGAFCRAYDIRSAIEEFLPGAYEDAGEDRLTFTGGSAAAGAVLYENGKFLYSHHNTDPCSGQLVNAFDLVRLHKFGQLDEVSDKPKKVTETASYNAMLELCRTTPEVIKHNLQFEEFEDKEWTADLVMDKKSQAPMPTTPNYELIIKNDPGLKDCVGFDAFKKSISVIKDLPWRNKRGKNDRWRDSDDAQLRSYIEGRYNIHNVGKCFDALNNVAESNSFNPVKDFIEREEWDGENRVETVFIDYLGAADTPLNRAFTRKSLIAAVARVYEPGIKFDNMLILIGKQGIRKSTILKKLGSDWFSDSFITVQGKDAYEQLQGHWIIEIAELSGFKKSESENIKHFLSKTTDSYRPAYGRRTEDYDRQSIFFGSTNDLSPLKDNTGNRRFWPVPVTGKGRHKIDEMPIGQIWAESKYYYDLGEVLFIGDELEGEAEQVQKDHYDEDDRVGLIQAYLDMPLPEKWEDMSRYERRNYFQSGSDLDAASYGPPTVPKDVVCIAEIWEEALGEDKGKLNTYAAKPVRSIMDQMPGWERYNGKLRFGSNYGIQRCYVRIKEDGEAVREKVEKRSRKVRRSVP